MTSVVLKNALRERLDTLESLWSRRDADGIVRELYTEVTEIAGAGSDALYRGSEALRELVTELVAGSLGASIRLDRLSPLGDAGAYSWVTWSVLPLEGSAFAMKSLFVWALTDAGWRIVADMYAEGEIAI